MNRSTGARLCATAAVGALSLALITGCSGGSSDDAEDGAKDTGSSASSSAPAAKALTSAELEKLLLAQGAVSGYKVDSGDDLLPKSKKDVKTDKPACDPLAWATGGLAPGDTGANASNSLTEDKKPSGAPTSLEDVSEADIENAFKINITFVGLSSYEGDGAEKAMKAVSDGVKACSGGYGVTADGENSKVTKVAEIEGAAGGDESVGFAEDVDMDGDGTATFHTQVVRKGNTIATFYTADFTALTGGKAAEVPAAVVQAQLARLK
ncbi:MULTISPECIES: hypothetical protein [unclassified Streptomyces]|uniref:hypothetical protein n=1 Tax=unclassified Streptomyces TaxID=2593676 RepID=UPI003D70F498